MCAWKQNDGRENKRSKDAGEKAGNDVPGRARKTPKKKGTGEGALLLKKGLRTIKEFAKEQSYDPESGKGRQVNGR